MTDKTDNVISNVAFDIMCGLRDALKGDVVETQVWIPRELVDPANDSGEWEKPE